MNNTHINITPETTGEREQQRLPKPLKSFRNEIHLTEEDFLKELGPTQVRSLLAFMVEPETERALAEAEMDNIVYAGLGEHRILGKARRR